MKSKTFVVLQSEDTEILELSRRQKFHKTPSIIHADLESLIKK